MANVLRPVIASDPRFRGYLPPNRWTLCVGAGISKGISPTWLELTNILVNEAFGTTFDQKSFVEMFQSSGWTLDGWIQSAANEFARLGKPIQEFVVLIETVLYSKIREKAKGCGLDKYLTQVLNHPKSSPKERVIEICDFLEANFSGSTLFDIGRFLIRSAKTDRAPRSVISFNADTFLETYIDLFLRREHYKASGPHSHPKYYFVSKSRTGTEGDTKIPIYHCHGSLAPFYGAGKSPHDARDRLIFLEQEYLTQSSNRASWAQTMFLFHAQSTKLAFCGLSMSDTNIRRWMSAIEIERSLDKNHLSAGTIINPEHIWIRPRPNTDEKERVYLSSLLHLGIRPAWILNWKSLEAELMNLSAVPSA